MASRDMRVMWGKVEANLIKARKLGEVPAERDEVVKSEKYYLRVIECWDGHKKQDVEHKSLALSEAVRTCAK